MKPVKKVVATITTFVCVRESESLEDSLADFVCNLYRSDGLDTPAAFVVSVEAEDGRAIHMMPKTGRKEG